MSHQTSVPNSFPFGGIVLYSVVVSRPRVGKWWIRVFLLSLLHGQSLRVRAWCTNTWQEHGSHLAWLVWVWLGPGRLGVNTQVRARVSAGSPSSMNGNDDLPSCGFRFLSSSAQATLTGSTPPRGCSYPLVASQEMVLRGPCTKPPHPRLSSGLSLSCWPFSSPSWETHCGHNI